MRFHETLARERKARGLSQEELAAVIQVSRQAVSKWETGDAMPDLNNLIALADALDISLDALCGRENHQEKMPPEPIAPVRKRSHFAVLLCVQLVILLGAMALWWWTQKDVVPAEEAVAKSVLAVMPEDFTVSGVAFHGKSDSRVGYQFTPGISGQGLAYQIIFTDPEGNSAAFDAPCEDGVCAGWADLEGGRLGYTVAVSVTDGVTRRNVAIACDLVFSKSGASWLPLEEAE